MVTSTRQMKVWQGEFGQEYTERNALSLEEMESLCKRYYGISRTQMNLRFLPDISPSLRILEVGCNIGNQLLCLQKAGFTNLYGIELQRYAVEIARVRTEGINIIQGSAFDLPFKDEYFELIFTSGLLIHISPTDIRKIADEIHRCTREYIWGFEYYADTYQKVNYRRQSDLLWKTDFVKLWLKRFPGLALIKETRFEYLENENIDTMFLLRKR